MQKRILIGYFIFLCLLCGFGSALTIMQNETQLIQSSDLIVYGKIVDVKSAWNAQKTHIETTAQVLVNDTLKNSNTITNLSGTTIAITVLGGAVGNDSEWVEEMPVLINETEAIFILKRESDGKNSVLNIITRFKGINESSKLPLSANDIVAFKQKITAIQNNYTAIPTTKKAGLLYTPFIAIIGFIILIHKSRK